MSEKKFFVFFSVIFLVGALVLPAMAKDIFEEDIVRCGAAFTPPVSCGENPPADDPLTRGEVQVDSDGEVRVVIKGAAANTIYAVFVGTWVDSTGLFQPKYTGGGSCGGQDIGTITTDANGNYKGPVITPSNTNFAFPAGTIITQLNFVFNNPPCIRTQFTTGISLP